MKIETAYHYTIRKFFEEIISSGYLDPAKSVICNRGVDERNILWFSTHDHWEPTANKAWLQNGTTRALSTAETHAKGGGAVRFGYPVKKLHAWKGEKLRRKARMEKKVALDLSAEGRRQGANPMDWYGALRKISITDLSIEVLDANGNWDSISQSNECGRDLRDHGSLAPKLSRPIINNLRQLQP